MASSSVEASVIGASGAGGGFLSFCSAAICAVNGAIATATACAMRSSRLSSAVAGGEKRGADEATAVAGPPVVGLNVGKADALSDGGLLDGCHLSLTSPPGLGLGWYSWMTAKPVWCSTTLC